MGGHGKHSGPVVPENIPSGKPNFKFPYPENATERTRAAVTRIRTIPPGWAIWSLFGFVTVLGYYQISKVNRGSANYLRETRELKMALYPYRKAEADLLLLGKLNAAEEYERKVMKDVEGWVPGQSVYKYRWLPPNEALQDEIDNIKF